MKYRLTHMALNLILFVFGVLVGYLYIPQNRAVSQHESVPAATQVQPEKTEEMNFLLISEGEKINIFLVEGEKKKLYSEISYIDLLSVDEKYREELEKGVILKGKEALAGYIQDLDS